MARYPLKLAVPAGTRPYLECDLLPGLQLPGQLVGIGENYLPPTTPAASVPGPAKGAAPNRRAGGQAPLVFGKFPGSLTGNGQPVIVDPTLSNAVVCEGELAVVLGQALKNARSAAEALAAVAGVTIANDISARDLQAADVQSTRGKSLDTFCPLGPDLVTLDEIPDLQKLQLVTRINGAVIQKSSTSNMVFSVAELLMFCSRFMTLYPGDVILTGTPCAADESVLKLHPGDTVSVQIQGVGTLQNPVISPETLNVPQR